MKSDVYFANIRARSDKENKISKIGRLFEAAGLAGTAKSGDITAIKLHFGQRGNDSYVSPVLVRPIVDKAKALGARPFLTDTNTLYGGGRANAVDHLQTALEHGFGYEVTGAPIIIADGLKSNSYREVKIDGKHFQSAKIASEIADADGLIVVSHFKGHLPAGFGGAIKNLGMGCAPALGKADQHSTRPIFHAEMCSGCGACARICPAGAIKLGKAIESIDYDACLGCGECLRACRNFAIDFDWLVEIPPFMERIAEYALGAVKGKEGKAGYFNFLLNITPDCDCVPWSDAPFVPDIGILASLDPVAIDQASYDLVNEQMGLQNSMLQKNRAPGEDKFSGLWENTDGLAQVEHAARVGLGSRDYRLIEI